MPGGSPALPNGQVNAPRRRSNDLPYRLSRPPILSRTPGENHVECWIENRF